MKQEQSKNERYATETLTALQAQRLAQEIAFGPIVFQVARIMLKFGIFDFLNQHPEGVTLTAIANHADLSTYAAQVLLESSVTTGTIRQKADKYFLAKAGWFLLNDDMVRVNLDFNHDVNYLGMFRLEESLRHAKPEGLPVFGDWKTIYEGLSQLPEQVQKSWFAFDHFYSDNSFPQALDIVFSAQPKTLLDVGGNTGRFATQCVQYNDTVEVTIMDLPQQLALMRQAVANLPAANRIHGYAANLLDPSCQFPAHFDAIWMSQFLDCFSETEVVSILSRAAATMSPTCRLYIMETLWDRQRFETASYCLAQISLYFTALANGNSKMFRSADLERCVSAAGLTIETIHDGLGLGHSIFVCKKN